ncbi:hypothetical protein NDU88_006894 [Pleurodeles waltl]|uniref:Secreted protein n=1 Tax=Pleurodeles waltl TaxID=8319 RepID=A0AAV7LRR8_PLEWA|nr:hypothetical protein NDU88_006894 [Pleurodeles waltl]
MGRYFYWFLWAGLPIGRNLRPSSRGGLQGRLPLPGPHLLYGLRARLLQFRARSALAALDCATASPPASVVARRPLFRRHVRPEFPVGASDPAVVV